jgi:hypothetical protein
MWIYSKKSNAAYNINHIARLFIETTGNGAALKAEIAGKPQMIAYYDDKDGAQVALMDILAKKELGIPMVRM